MRIDLTPDHLLSTATRQRINELSDAVYPPGSASDWATAPIQWAPQTIRAMIWDEERLVCHVGALVRTALIDDRSVLVGGIGGVMTAPARRRQGHARAAVTAMRHHLIDERQVAFSLLFCAADLYRFYGQLGWKLFENTPLVEQVNAPPPKGGGFELRLKAGLVRLWRTQVTLKSSSGSGGVWFLIYSAHTSSVTLPLLVTQ